MSHTNLTPLVIIGLDAADPDLLIQWAETGHLPNIARLMGDGAWARTTGAEQICEHGIWLSLFSGLSRGKFGYYYFNQINPGSYDLVRTNGYDIQAKPFWADFKDQNIKSLVIDAPDNDLISGIKGVQISGWAEHHMTGPLRTWPESIKSEIEKQFDSQITVEEDLYSNLNKDKMIFQSLLSRTEKKGSLIRHYLKKNKFDLAVFVFGEPHTATHQFWKYRHKESPLKTAILDVYKKIDEQIEKIKKDLPQGSNIVLFSSTGMQDQYPCLGIVNDLCKKLGYMHTKETKKTGLNLINFVRSVLPPSWRLGLSNLLPASTQQNLFSSQFFSNVDWSKTRAFSIPSTYTSFIRINLKGREPEGIVDPGNEYYELLNQIIDDFKLLKDPATGEGVVKSVEKAHELFGSDCHVALPDLIVEWKAHEHFLRELVHPKARINQEKPVFYRGSDHTREGLFVACGPDIRPTGELSSVNILDAVPTFLRLLGMKSTRKLVGRALEQILR